MRLVITADLHYDVARSQEPTRRLAREISALDADALLILGDVGGRDPGIVGECLSLFDRFAGRKFFVAGNHDIWTHPGEDSLHRLEVQLPEICAAHGFHDLGAAPAVVGDVGLVGSMAWYDYGYRPSWLGVPLRFYEAKVGPGAAARLPELEHLMDDDIPPSARDVTARWMDGEHVRMDLCDVDLCHRLCDRLTEHLREVAPRVRTIVAGLHHVPFEEIVPRSPRPTWAFAGAFMGSAMFGRALQAEPKVHHVYCGHSHRGMGIRRNGLVCVNIGSTYKEKLHDVLDLPEARRGTRGVKESVMPGDHPV